MSVFDAEEGDVHFHQHLDSNGDGTGSHNVTGDYSVTPEIFYSQPSLGWVYFLQKLIIQVEDTNGFQAEEYGNLGAALTNGLVLRVSNDTGVKLLVTNGDEMKTNADWAAHCYDADLKSWGAGNEVLVARWSFDGAGLPIRLVGAEKDRLELVANDNFTGLITHHFFLQGFKRKA